MELQRPPRLEPGDRLAAVTLSWGGPGAVPHRYEAGKRQLQDRFDVELVEMPHTLDSPAAEPRQRAADLHRAFADPTIAGVVSTIGGDDSIRVLPHLDLELLAANPKPFIGYSDSTITHMALRRAGLVSFYGSSVMTGFAENGGIDDYLVAGVERMLFASSAPVDWPENHAGWTVEELDWSDPTTHDQVRVRHPSTEWRWHGGAPASGPTVVGCLEVLDWLRGTAWWPELAGAVLVLETSEEQPSPDVVARFLRVLAVTGELEALAGLVFGRPGGADLPIDGHTAYDEAILEVVRGEEGLAAFPVVCGVDIGHTDPVWTVPQGVPLRIDPRTEQLTFLDAGVV